MSNCCEIKVSDVKCCQDGSNEGSTAEGRSCSFTITVNCDCGPDCCRRPQEGEAQKRCC